MTTHLTPSERPLPVIALTLGDPAGIGPELCLRMLSDPAVLAHCQPVVFGESRLLQWVATACRLPPPAEAMPYARWVKAPVARPGLVIDVPGVDGTATVPGKSSAAGGRIAYLCLEIATHEALAQRVAGVVTAPLSKASLSQAGVPFPGHTEILARLTGTTRYCMMLASEKITTSLVTTHTALASVPSELSAEGIVNTIQLTHAAMKRVGHASPRLVVCALNPHAGEDGLFGAEEQRFIEPAIRRARHDGLQVEGPVPPDTAFLPERLARTDAYICMYHDQGLIPFKMLSFEVGVNVTLGLPIVRTSPDHGTAFDLAWSGRANPSSMREAVLYAVRLC
jgi:4-hydroxythreonine-4-phosphate dehydrogenase